MAGQYDAFDSDDSGSSNKPDKAIWELGDIYNKSTWAELSKWLAGEKIYLQQENRDRFKRIENNLALYKGVQYHSQDTRDDSSERGIDRSKSLSKIVANHIYDLVQNKVSRLIKFKPGIVALPTANELEDRVGSKMSESLIRHIWYQQNFEGEVQNDFIKAVHVMGEAYLGVVWDPNSGDILEDMKDYMSEMSDKGEVTLTGDDGKPDIDESGKPIKLTRVVKYGDVVYEIWYTLDCLVDRQPQFKQAEYMFHRRLVANAIVKKIYPEVQNGVGSTSDAQYYDYEKMQVKNAKGKVAVWTMYHKKTEYLPKGAVIKFINDKVVSCVPLKDTQGDLPVLRLTDIDLPGETHGESFISQIKGLTGTYNNLTNLILRNQVLTSHPKWVFPLGSVRKESLGNDITLVEYKGAQPPLLMQQNPTPGEVFQFRDQLKQEFQQIAGIFGVSRGEPPPGVKAGVALQFLAEQENERFNEMVLKYNEWIRQTAIKTLERCADNYESDDKRMIMVIGKQNQWMSTFFDVKYLSRRYDVRVQNASALPQSKAAKTQYLLDLNEQFPEMVPGEMVLDMLDISQPDKFIDYNTVTVRAAEAENESIMQGVGELNDPQDYEDHILMWKVHMKQMREWSFKNQTDKSVQDRMMSHVMAHEMLMVQKAQQNPMYLEQCMQLPSWPVFSALPMPPQPQPPGPPLEPMGMPQEAPLPPDGAYQEERDQLNIPPPSEIQQAMGDNQIPQDVGPIDPTTAI